MVKKKYFPNQPITKELLEYLYIIKNMMRKEIAEFLDIPDHVVKQYLKTLHIKKDISLRVKNNEKTCLERYGTTNAGGIPKTLEKIKNTNKQRYGNEVYFHTNDYKEKQKIFLKNNNVTNVFQLETTKEKIQITNLKRYGVKHNMQCIEVRQKVNQTKHRNHTFNSSAPESFILYLLKIKYATIKYQYTSCLYPFNCDFYIPELDLYIEYQGFWTHGNYHNTVLGPYDSKNETHVNILNIWKAKNTKIYDGAIETWTMRDPLKRETAKKNNLNWLEFFTIEEFLNWYKTQNGTPLLEYKSSKK